MQLQILNIYEIKPTKRNNIFESNLLSVSLLRVYTCRFYNTQLLRGYF